MDYSEYRKKLEGAIHEYMNMPASERTANAICAMMGLCDRLDEKHRALTHEDIVAWNRKMLNEDGSVGGHWTVEQTTAVAISIGVEFTHISAMCWNVTMNMMYSDYFDVAQKYGVAVPEFFADMAKAFLFDKDAPSPREKLSAYYFNIAK